jgi:hypothetical protein
VALAAIQGLYEVVREKDARIVEQQRTINELRAEKDADVAALRDEINELKDMLRRLSADKGD